MDKMPEYGCNIITNVLIKRHAKITDLIKHTDAQIASSNTQLDVKDMLRRSLPLSKQRIKDIENTMSNLQNCGCNSLTNSHN